MGRKPKRKPKSQAEFASREEFEHRLCYAYVECGSYNAVAKQFGTHAQVVKRAWEKLSEDQKQSIRDAHEKVAENISRKVKKSIFAIARQEDVEGVTEDEMVEALNRSTMKAEALVSDGFVENVIQARMLLGQELTRRCGDSLRLQMMSNKDFATLLRLVATISEPQKDKDDDEGAKGNGTLEKLRIDMAKEIYKQE